MMKDLLKLKLDWLKPNILNKSKSSLKKTWYLKLNRVYNGKDYTIGKLYVNGTYFCDTIEDPVRTLKSKADKIPGKTAIPPGIYKIILNESPKFKRILPRLIDVPFFDGILIHRGNRASDSEGCIIVGENTSKGVVTNSTYYEKELVRILLEAQDNSEDIYIEII